MARSTAQTPGMIGVFNERPVQTGITVPFRYLEYIQKRIKLEERGSLSMVIRELLVKEFGCPVDESDAETILEDLELKIGEERQKKAKAARQLRLMEEAAAEQEKNDSEE